jgi:membrane protein DedA with SNARE-associated domain/membrane-associated phospholipid phosphatase
MDHIQPFLEYFTAHPGWAIAIIFLIAFGEALLIIGLFVPSTAVLVGAGVLVGTDHLEFWEVFLATAIGAIAGDQVSYWAGRLYGQQLKAMWPLSRYPVLVAKGEDFVRDHGGKSIAVGRFVPGVKAVIPGIVGMLGMSQPFFVFVNFTSGIAWALAHVLPGMLLGQGLALAGELSGRLVVVLLVLLVILSVVGYTIRLAAAGVSPYLHQFLARISRWAKSYNSRAMQRFGRAVAPENPRASLIFLFICVLVLGLLWLADLIAGLVVRDAVSNLDQSIVSLMAELRNAPADGLMVGLSMLADRVVVWSAGLAMVIWLFVWRAWRVGLLALCIMLCGELLSMGLGWLVERPAPIAGIDVLDGTFPSGHVLMAGLALGLLSVLASHAMGRWSRAVVAAASGCVVTAIAFSRVYIGADWLSDVLGGALLAAVLCAVFGMIIEAIPSRRIRPLGLLGFTLMVGMAAGFLHIEEDHDRQLAIYALPDRIQAYDKSAWSSGAWENLSPRRVDLAGQPEEVFAALWVGNLDSLASDLEKQGWSRIDSWTWKDSVAYIDSNASLANLAPRPLLHQGLRAKLTMTKTSADGSTRQVLRAFRSQAEVVSEGGKNSVYLLSLTPEILRKRFFLLSMPSTLPTSGSDVNAFLDGLRAAPNVLLLAQSSDGGKPAAVFQARP